MTLKQKWKDLRKAKKEERIAENEITVATMFPKDKVCINKIVVIISSSLTPGFCECFNQDKVCDNKNCAMADKNARYVLARNNYKQKRSEFFDSIFHGREK